MVRIDGSSRPVVRDDLISRRVDEDFFVYDPVSDRVVLLNLSAAVVFDLCDGTRTPDEIAEEVARVFGSERDEVALGVRAALEQLAGSALLRNAVIAAAERGRRG